MYTQEYVRDCEGTDARVAAMICPRLTTDCPVLIRQE